MQYTIGQLAHKLDFTESKLRYYEKQGLLKPNRKNNYARTYFDEDIDWIQFIIHLKNAGMTIEQIKYYIKLRSQGDSTLNQRYKLLRKVQAKSIERIKRIQQSMEVLNNKVDWYDEKMKGTISNSETFKDYVNRLRSKNS